MSTKAYNEHEGVRWSAASAGLVSGLQLAHELANGREDTAAMGLGRTAHLATLVPHYPIPVVPSDHLTPSGTLSTGAKTKAWARDCVSLGLEYSSPADIETARDIAEAVNGHPIAAETLAICKVREVPVYAELPGVGPVKACPDLYDPKTGMLADIKTHSSRSGPVSLRSVRSAIIRYNYAAQMAFYRRVMAAAGLHVSEIRLVFVESAAPHDVIVVRLGEDWMAYGEELVDRALATWVTVAAGTVQGIAPGLVDLELPAWLVDDDANSTTGLDLEGIDD